MSKHTPGPWSVSGRMTRYVSASIYGGWIQEVAAVGPTLADNGYGEQQEANARLIAAAPELLSALNAMLTHMGMDEDEWNKPTFDQARAAIAKATGEQA